MDGGIGTRKIALEYVIEVFKNKRDEFEDIHYNGRGFAGICSVLSSLRDRGKLSSMDYVNLSLAVPEPTIKTYPFCWSKTANGDRARVRWAKKQLEKINES